MLRACYVRSLVPPRRSCVHHFGTRRSGIQELCYLGLAAVITALAFYSRLPDGMRDSTPWFVRLCYVLQVSNLLISLFVAALYWGLDWPFKEGFPAVPYTISPFTHGVNFLFAAADFFVCGLPLDFTMYYAPALFAFAYLLSSLAISGGEHAHGEPYMFTVLDCTPTAAHGMLTPLITYRLLIALRTPTRPNQRVEIEHSSNTASRVRALCCACTAVLSSLMHL